MLSFCRNVVRRSVKHRLNIIYTVGFKFVVREEEELLKGSYAVDDPYLSSFSSFFS